MPWKQAVCKLLIAMTIRYSHNDCQLLNITISDTLDARAPALLFSLEKERILFLILSHSSNVRLFMRFHWNSML